jgi:hypothetical protein
MSPNTNLKEQLRIAKRMLRRLKGYDENMGRSERDEYNDSQVGDGKYLAELVLALDESIAVHGLLPRRWQPVLDEGDY